MLLDTSPRLSSCALPRLGAGGARGGHASSHGHLLDSPKAHMHQLPLLSTPTSSSSSSTSHSRRGSFQEPRILPSRPGSAHNNGTGPSTFASSSALVLDSDGNAHDPGYLNGLMDLHAAIGNAATSHSSHRRRSSAMKPRRASWLGGSALVTDDDIEYSSSDEDEDDVENLSSARRFGGASPSYLHGSGRSTVRPSLDVPRPSSSRASFEQRGSPLLEPPSSAGSKQHRLSWSSGVSEERKAGSRRSSGATGSKPQTVTPLDDWSVGGFTGIVDIEKARRESSEQSRQQAIFATPRSMDMSKSRSRSRSTRSSPSGSVDDATWMAASQEAQYAAAEEAAVLALPQGSPLRQALVMSSPTKRRPSETSTSTINGLRQPAKRTLRSASDAPYTEPSLLLAGRPTPRTYQTTAVPRLSTIRSGALQNSPNEARFSDLAAYTSQVIPTSEAVEAERERRAAEEARVARAPNPRPHGSSRSTTDGTSFEGSSAAQACAHSIKRGFQSFALGVRFKARFARRRLDGTL